MRSVAKAMVVVSLVQRPPALEKPQVRHALFAMAITQTSKLARRTLPDKTRAFHLSPATVAIGPVVE